LKAALLKLKLLSLDLLDLSHPKRSLPTFPPTFGTSYARVAFFIFWTTTFMVKIRTLFALLLITTASYAALPVAVDGQPLPSLAPMLQNTTSAVVNISTSTETRIQNHPLLNDPFFSWFFERPQRRQRQQENQSLGSGVIVDAQKGYVLTNQHVIDEAKEIKVTLKDGRHFIAKLLGQDPETDIAVLQIPAEKLQAVSFSDSDQLRVGDFVVAIGSPFGLNQTVTSGIVSALGRSGLGIEGYENFIQTDASINPGNSGGPLVNLRGDLVGINTAILAPSGGNVGIGFAIPANMAKAIMRQIVEFGGVNRGVFGISVQNLDAELAQALGIQQRQGAMVSGVKPGSPAEQAGLRAGDVIVSINQHQVTSATDLHSQLGLTRVGELIELDVFRQTKRLRLSARIADRYANFTPGKEISEYFEGALFNEVLDSSHLGDNNGILVGKVKPDSNAWRTGLRDEDVVFEVNRRRIYNLSDLADLMHNSSRVWQLKLRRGQQLLTLSSR
jgi:Do/DeqQ family serine protease